MHRLALYLSICAAIIGLVFFVAHPALAATNVYYSVGQSTSTNLMTGSPTVTLTSGTAVFSVAQTGNIGVGDKVIYGASSSIAFISGKVTTDDTQWSLVTATGSIPTNVSGASVTSITRAFASLSSAISGFTGANYLATSSLVGANAIVNIPCYYDTGADTSQVTIPSSIITATSTYLNIYTPNNTSTQSNFSQRHTGKWTSNAYQLTIVSSGVNTDMINVQAGYVRITGLQIGLTIASTSFASHESINFSNLASTTPSFEVVDSNIIQTTRLTADNNQNWGIYNNLERVS